MIVEEPCLETMEEEAMALSLKDSHEPFVTVRLQNCYESDTWTDYDKV